MQVHDVFFDRLDVLSQQREVMKESCQSVIAAATAIKHGAVALGIIALSDAFDVRRLNLEEIELLDGGAEIHDISGAIEAEAESVLAGADPANCSARIAEQLKRLFAVADDEQVDWGASVSIRFIGQEIERKMQSLAVHHQ